MYNTYFWATGSSCVACYVNRKCATDNQQKFLHAYEKIKRNIYMNNLYVTSASLGEAIEQMKQINGSLSQSGFFYRFH